MGNVSSTGNFSRERAEADEPTIFHHNVCDEFMTYVERNVNTLIRILFEVKWTLIQLIQLETSTNRKID